MQKDSKTRAGAGKRNAGYSGVRCGLMGCSPPQVSPLAASLACSPEISADKGLLQPCMLLARTQGALSRRVRRNSSIWIVGGICRLIDALCISSCASRCGRRCSVAAGQRRRFSYAGGRWRQAISSACNEWIAAFQRPIAGATPPEPMNL